MELIIQLIIFVSLSYKNTTYMYKTTVVKYNL